MGKKRRGTTQAIAPAERHDFSAGGYLGHDTSTGLYQVNVNERTLLAVDVAYSCVRFIADGVSGGSWGEYQGETLLTPSALVRRPSMHMTRREWTWLVSATAAIYNYAPLRRIGGTPRSGALSLVPIAPPRLTTVDGRILLDGTEELQPSELRIVRRAMFPTVSAEQATIIRLAREILSASWAADSYRADFWQNGGNPSLVLTTDQKLDNTQADEVSDRWVERRATHPGRPAVLGQGISAKPLGADLSASGATEALEDLGAAVARYFGVPVAFANVKSHAGSLTYTTTEGEGQHLIRYTLGAYSGAIQDAITEELPGDPFLDRHMAISLDHLTRPGMLERYQAYDVALDAPGKPGWMTAAEIRKNEGMPPDAGIGLHAGGTPAPAMETITHE